MNEMIIIEKELTPENASSKNLFWVKDIIIDPEAPKEATTDITKFVEEGYVFGQSASTASDNNFVGLYKKIILE